MTNLLENQRVVLSSQAVSTKCHVEIGMMENLKGKNNNKGAIMWKRGLFRLFLFLEVRKEEMKSLREPRVCVSTCACTHGSERDVCSDAYMCV